MIDSFMTYLNTFFVFAGNVVFIGLFCVIIPSILVAMIVSKTVRRIKK